MSKPITPKFDPTEKFFTTQEAGKLLGMHPETVKKKCAAGLILASKPGKVYRIPQSSITELLTRNATR